MKVLLTKKIVDLDGEEIKGEKGEAFTLRDALISALMASYEVEKDLPGKDKLERYNLALRVKRDEEINLTSEEIVLLKRLVGMAYGVLVVGQVYEELEK
jgi:hypothetical protein